MKHGKKPTVRQAVFLKEKGYTPHEWFVVKDTPAEMFITARNEDETVIALFKYGSK